MNGLDLFSGIGGLTKALDGYVIPIAYCEIEPYARGVLLSRQSKGEIPYAPIWDDVTTLRGTDLPPIDIIYGGFPCQDISVAGRGAGLAGERSGLFFEIVRLAKEIKPKFIFLENVPNIRTKGLGRVVRELADLGYDCRWGALSASDVGANHKRERWFLLAHSRSPGRDARNLHRTGDNGFAAGERRSAIASESSETSTPMADSGGQPGAQESSSPSSIREGRDSRSDDSGSDGRTISRNDWWLSEPNVGRVAHGIPRRVERLRALGNAVVPAQAREAFERLMGLKGEL